MPTTRKVVNIIGGGPAGMSLATHLDPEKYEVHIYERNAKGGRKFLVAGKGGFNLTHGEPMEVMHTRYTPYHFLREALLGFDNAQFRAWLDHLGIGTYVGSSNRVFPNPGIKPVEVYQNIEQHLLAKGVKFHTRHIWKGFDEGLVLVENEQKRFRLKGDYTVFALGGASWKKTGSQGEWCDYFEQYGISCHEFWPSNCALQVKWPEALLSKHEGSPIKNIEVSCGDLARKGELIITRFGLEGGPVYAMSPEVRRQLQQDGTAHIRIDLKPQLDHKTIHYKLTHRNAKHSQKRVLREQLKLSPAVCDLLQYQLSKEEYTQPDLLSQTIKALPIEIMGMAPIDEAISTVGGIALSEVNEHFELKKLENHFCIGEMLDWDAPTGGYLLQACFSSGHYLAQHLNAKRY